MVQDFSGGIAALFSILKDHWGAVERDLWTGGCTFDDLGSRRLPLSALVAVAVYAQPGTSVFHAINKGVVTSDYLLAQINDGIKDLLWAKTTDAFEDQPRNRPKRTWLPGMPEPAKEPERVVMTVEDYERMSGGG